MQASSAHSFGEVLRPVYAHTVPAASNCCRGKNTWSGQQPRPRLHCQCIAQLENEISKMCSILFAGHAASSHCCFSCHWHNYSCAQLQLSDVTLLFGEFSLRSVWFLHGRCSLGQTSLAPQVPELESERSLWAGERQLA
jgi:hypothetical protein